MAKNRGTVLPLSNSEPVEEMIVFGLRLKGGSDTMQKGFEALGQAFGAMGIAPVVMQARHLSSPSTDQASKSQAGADVESLEEVDQPSTVTAAPFNSSAPKKSGPRKYKYNDKLDLNQSEKPWKQFAAEKAPGSDNKCYLVAAQWLTENANTPEFGIADVFTLFRAMKWNEQGDFSQPLRKMKANSSYFDNPTVKTWKLTSIGLEAARELKATETAK